jgi:hypothetical protein
MVWWLVPRDPFEFGAALGTQALELGRSVVLASAAPVHASCEEGERD